MATIWFSYWLHTKFKNTTDADAESIIINIINVKSSFIC